MIRPATKIEVESLLRFFKKNYPNLYSIEYTRTQYRKYRKINPINKTRFYYLINRMRRMKILIGNWKLFKFYRGKYRKVRGYSLIHKDDFRKHFKEISDYTQRNNLNIIGNILTNKLFWKPLMPYSPEKVRKQIKEVIKVASV